MIKGILVFAVGIFLINCAELSYAKGNSSPSKLCEIGSVLKNLTENDTTPAKLRFSVSKNTGRLESLLLSLAKKTDKVSFKPRKSVSVKESLDIRLSCDEGENYFFRCDLASQPGVIGCSAN